MFQRVLLALCLIAVPLTAHAQVVNLAVNPSLEQDEVILDDPDWADWYTWNDAAGAGSNVEFDNSEFIDGTRSLRIEPIGTENWHFIVANDGNAVTMGANNTVSFWAKAEEIRPLGAHIKATDNSIDFGYTDFTLSTEWAEYTFTFEALITPVKVEFFCATSETNFWLDFLNVYEGEYVGGILPSEINVPGSVKPADKLSVTWGALKLAQ
ncbi:carbohydrate binding domain-containing protein [Candidatus Poribacteria bacterium]